MFSLIFGVLAFAALLVAINPQAGINKWIAGLTGNNIEPSVVPAAGFVLLFVFTWIAAGYFLVAAGITVLAYLVRRKLA